MKQIDVMKQALEALKRLKAYGNVFRFRQDEQNPYDQSCEAIAILRTAIEQAERQQALDKKAENARELGLDYEPVQAEKQAPFGYLWPTGRHPEFRFTQQLRDGVEGTPVYTTPQPQREWVGLTDYEIRKEFHPLHQTGLEFARAIETKLKELNHVS